MAERSIFWDTNGTGDGATQYTEADLMDLFRRLFTDGVLDGIDSELAVSGTSSPVAVAAGAAMVYGTPYWNTASVNVTVSTPVLGTTGHRVVLRKSWADQEVRIELLSSSDGVSAIPAITQSVGTTWDLSLATLTITTGGVITVTDTRTYAQVNSNNVKRDGDTMTGNLGISSSTPTLRMTETDAPANGQKWDRVINGNTLAERITNDADSVSTTWLEVIRSGIGLSSINFPVGVNDLVRNGNKIWDSGNDGAGSGLDADTLDGLDSTDLARLGAASDFTTAPTINGNTVWTSGNDGTGSGLDADTLDGIQSTGFARLGATSDFTTAPTINGNTVWNSGNDGSGSGLDADKVRGNIIIGGTAVDTVSVPATTGVFVVNFGITFGGTPKVVVTNQNALTTLAVSTSSISTTQVAVHWRTITGGNFTGTVTVDWIAIGT